MKKGTFIFIDQIYACGGVETYIYRMSKWLISNEYDVILMLPEKCSEIDEKLLEDTRKLGVKILFNLPVPNNHNYGMPTFNIKLNLPEKTKVYIISTTIADLYIAEALMYSNQNINFINIAYMLHPEAFVYKDDKSNFFNKIFFNREYKKIKTKLIKNNILYFLSEEHKKTFVHTTYKKQIDGRILRLGININDLNKEKILHHYNKREKILLTVSRFDFPFKNYLKGLVKSLAVIDNQNIRMKIIGWGKDEKELVKTIKKLPSSLQQRISIIGGVSYSELCDYLNDSYIYIGEGTSVLDAINNNVVSIVVNEYDDECKTDGFFSDNYNVTTTSCTKYKIDYLLNKVLSFSEEEYVEQFMKDYKTFEEHYNIDKVMNLITSIENNNAHSITKFQIKKYMIQKYILINLKNLVNKIKKRK